MQNQVQTLLRNLKQLSRVWDNEEDSVYGDF